MFLLIVVANALVLDHALVSSSEMRISTQAMSAFQKAEECFPLKETVYLVHRNFEIDPYNGNNATCVRATEISDYKDDCATVTVEYPPNNCFEVNMCMAMNPGYKSKNLMTVEKPGVPEATFNITVAYRDCDNCMVFRHGYASEGNGCSYWVPESKLDKPNTSCEFIYMMLCGDKPKYQIYSNCEKTMKKGKKGICKAP
ncbi:uncharacterized protein LOC144144962 [Haemaphysalis longicornis]